MLDGDHRLIYVLSSHQTGAGSWLDFLVFGCVSGRVKKVFLGQFCPEIPEDDVFDLAPPALRSALREYFKHLYYANKVDCDHSSMKNGLALVRLSLRGSIRRGISGRTRSA